VIKRLSRVKMPFSVSALSVRIAIEALSDETHVRRSREMVASEKPWLVEKLSALGLRPYPTDANFMLIHVGKRRDAVVRHLLDRGIAVRATPERHGLEACMRVTIGRREHNERLIKAIGEFTL